MSSMCRCQNWCVQTGMLQPSVAAALGVIQIMVALFYLGLGPRQIFNFPVDSIDTGATFWLGVVYLTAGVLVVVAGLSLSVCLMRVAVSVNLIGAIIATVGIVLYAIDLGAVSVVWICRSYREDKNNCLKVASIAQRLLTATYITIILLSVLQLCVCTSFVVLGIKVFNRSKQGDKSAPLLPTEDLSYDVM